MEQALLELAAAAIRIATPLLLAALGGLLSERAGIFAVGLEGMMLIGACAAVMVTYASGSPLLGIVLSAVVTATFALLIAVPAIVFRADQIVVGLSANILAIGLTSFTLRAVAGHGIVRVDVIKPLAIPLLADIPFIGPLFFQQPPLTYAAIALAVPVALLLRRTHFGLALRAAGENPGATYALGSNPARLRFQALMLCGALAGLAGAVLTLQQVGAFTDNMTAGRGYIALAAIIAARWSPYGAILTGILFGASEALQYRVQSFGLPVSSYLVQTTPYLVSLLILAMLGRYSRMPAALGRPHD